MTACRSLFDHTTIRRLARLSGPGSDSPAETSLRLTIAPVVAEMGGNLVPQLPILRDDSIGAPCEDVPTGRLLTAVDLADVVHGVAYYYDGGKHLDRKHRDRGSFITSELSRMGWLLVRVSAGLLRRPIELRERVRKLYLQRAA